MKKLFFAVPALAAAVLLVLPALASDRQAQGAAPGPELKPIKLNPPDLKRGLPLMQTLSVRASATDWSDADLSLQDLSDLLWAANGINRPDNGKRTAASAINAQDVDIYVFMRDGAYLYDFKAHALVPVVAGDYRLKAGTRPGGPGGKPGAKPGEKPQGPPPGGMPAGKPGDRPQGPPPGGSRPAQPTPGVLLVLVSETARFKMGPPEMKATWGAIDTGIVSQNIALFCASTGLATRPRASADTELIKSILKLTDTQIIMLNHPVGYPKVPKK